MPPLWGPSFLKSKRSLYMKRITSLVFLLMCVNPSFADPVDLVGNTTVSALFNDFLGAGVLLVRLTPPVSPAYEDCGGGNTENNDNSWVFSVASLETESSPEVPQTHAEKAYALFTVAWLTGMKVTVQGVYESEVCVPQYIILHNPSA